MRRQSDPIYIWAEQDAAIIILHHEPIFSLLVGACGGWKREMLGLNRLEMGTQNEE